MKQSVRRRVILSLLVFMISILSGCKADENAAAPDKTLTYEDLQTARIGVLTGTLFPDIVHHAMPDTELLYFNTSADLLNALKGHKVDAFATDEPCARYIRAQDDTVEELPELLDDAEYGYVLPKSDAGAKLCAELSAYLSALKADGTMDAMQKKWFDSPVLDALEMPDYTELPATNGTIRLVTSQIPPFSYATDTIHRGYEIELIAMFCSQKGYALEVTETTFDGILASVQSGKSDIGCSSITVTPERAEMMLFSEPDYMGGTALVVNVAGAKGAASFFSSIAESFEKTFIRENRWKLFVAGIGTTLLITILSIFLGTILGFGTYMLCRNGNRVANVIADFCIWLVRGLPVVVLLMILYYIIFGSMSVSGTTISVIGFTLVFAAGVYGMIKSGVGALDRGQFEAAYALGYTNRMAFYRVILPQAVPHFMPAYRASITETIKATAIVGYVAVQDLTKMGDIVRSRTYEAFFPLIAVAIIYIILAAILTFLVNKAAVRLDKKQRTKEQIIKEVEDR